MNDTTDVVMAWWRTRPEPPRHPLGAMGRLALWSSRCMLVSVAVLLPLAAAGGVSPDDQAWLSFGAVAFLLAAAAAGVVYSIRAWNDPPWWAWVLGRASYYRSRVHPFDEKDQGNPR